MTGAFTVSCIQFTSARDYEPNIRVVADLVRRARDGGADFVMTPENTGLTEPVGKLRREKARDEANHPVLAALREVAQETGVWLLIGSLAIDLSRERGTAEGERRLANRSYLVDPGGAVTAMPILQDHGDITSLGFRFGAMAYSPDLVGLPEAGIEALRGIELWIVDALWYRPHPSHFHLELTLQWIDRIKPKRAILTNMHSDLDFAQLRAKLPPNVEPAFDGMRVEFDE